MTCIAKSLSCDRIDFVQHCTSKWLGRTLEADMKHPLTRRGVQGQLLDERLNRIREVVGIGLKTSQALHRISPVTDRADRLIDRLAEVLFSFSGMFRKELVCNLIAQ